MTYVRTNTQAKSNMPHQFFQSWGHNDLKKGMPNEHCLYRYQVPTSPSPSALIYNINECIKLRVRAILGVKSDYLSVIPNSLSISTFVC